MCSPVPGEHFSSHTRRAVSNPWWSYPDLVDFGTTLMTYPLTLSLLDRPVTLIDYYRWRSFFAANRHSLNA